MVHATKLLWTHDSPELACLALPASTCFVWMVLTGASGGASWRTMITGWADLPTLRALSSGALCLPVMAMVICSPAAALQATACALLTGARLLTDWADVLIVPSLREAELVLTCALAAAWLLFTLCLIATKGVYALWHTSEDPHETLLPF